MINGILCTVFFRTGLAAVFFLVPLSFIAYNYNIKTLWTAVLAGILGNSVSFLALNLMVGGGAESFIWDFSFFGLMTVLFAWILVPPYKVFGVLAPGGTVRLITASVAGSIFFLCTFFLLREDSSFSIYLKNQAELISSYYIASAGSDVVRQSLLEEYLRPDKIINMMKDMLLRGGAVVFCILFFFVSRQLGLFITRVFRRRMPGKGLADFHVPFGLVWGLSAALLLVVIASFFKISIAEIAGWNILAVCVILYLAQGWGIMLHLVTRSRLPPFMRLALHVLFIFLILSPGLNAVSLGALALLGIAENWASFRTPKTGGSSSTPGM
ncbi:MAG: YybS family protein [Treponema sp.]|nr:YybS family protein [Treponema sp.]